MYVGKSFKAAHMWVAGTYWGKKEILEGEKLERDTTGSGNVSF